MLDLNWDARNGKVNTLKRSQGCYSKTIPILADCYFFLILRSEASFSFVDYEPSRRHNIWVDNLHNFRLLGCGL